MNQGESTTAFPKGIQTEVNVSCIILTWNSKPYLTQLFESLERDLCDSPFTHEYVVLDNGSNDGTLEQLDCYIKSGLPMRVVPFGINTGTTFSRNVGIRMARGKFLAILDSDVELLQEKTIEQLIAVLAANPQTGIVAPALIYESGKHQKTVDRFPTFLHKVKRRFFLRKMEENESLQAQAAQLPIQVDYACSAFWILRRSLCDEIGLLDTKIFFAPEDVDFCLRCWLAGYQVIYDRSVCAMHHAQEISRTKVLSKTAILHAKGLFYFFRKYKCFISLRQIRRKIDKYHNKKGHSSSFANGSS